MTPNTTHTSSRADANPFRVDHDGSWPCAWCGEIPQPGDLVVERTSGKPFAFCGRCVGLLSGALDVFERTEMGLGAPPPRPSIYDLAHVINAVYAAGMRAR